DRPERIHQVEVFEDIEQRDQCRSGAGQKHGSYDHVVDDRITGKAMACESIAGEDNNGHANQSCRNGNKEGVGDVEADGVPCAAPVVPLPYSRAVKEPWIVNKLFVGFEADGDHHDNGIESDGNQQSKETGFDGFAEWAAFAEKGLSGSFVENARSGA